MYCFEDKKGMFAVVMQSKRSNYLIAKFEIELVIGKFGDYSITVVNRGEEFVFYTNLPFAVYYRLKDKLKRRNHLTF